MVPLDIVFCKKFRFPAAVAGTTIMSQGVASALQTVSLIVQPENPSRVLEGEGERQPHSPSIFPAAFIIKNNGGFHSGLCISVYEKYSVRNICPASAWWLFQPPAGTTYPTQSSGGFCCPARTTALATQHEKFWKSLWPWMAGGAFLSSRSQEEQGEVLMSGCKETALSRKSLGNKEGEEDSLPESKPPHFPFSVCVFSVILLWDQAWRLLL